MNKVLLAITMGSSPVVFLWSGAALAQAQGGAVTQAATPVDPDDGDHIVLGVGAAVVPVFQGAKDFRVRPVPAIDIQKGWLFANLRNGIGIAPIRTEHVTLGAGVVYLQGYRHRDVPTGIDKLSDGVGARVFADLRGAGFAGTLGVTKGFAGQTKGVLVDATIGYPLPISGRVTLIPSVGTTWADSKYNDRYFGIDARESAASGLSRFTPGAGFKDVSGTLTARYRLSDRIGVSVTGGIVTLLGDVKASPLVSHATRPTGLLSFSYRLQ